MKCEREQFEMMPNFEQIIFLALRRAYEVHENLGSRGEELIQKNQFGETALRIDIEAEEAVINVLKENNIPIRIISEEHGQIDIMPNPKSKTPNTLKYDFTSSSSRASKFAQNIT